MIPSPAPQCPVGPIDLARGLDLSSLPPELESLDQNGDGFLRGLGEIRALNWLIWETRSPTLWTDPRLRLGIQELDPLFPVFYPSGDDPQTYKLFFQGGEILIRHVGASCPDPSVLYQIGSGIQLFPPAHWRDLTRHQPIELVIGNRPDLIEYTRREFPVALKIIQDPEHPGYVLAVVEATGAKTSVVAIDLDSSRWVTKLTGLERFGAAVDTIYLEGLIHLTVHQLGHLLEGALTHQLGTTSGPGPAPSSPLDFLASHSEEGGTCDPDLNLAEYLPEALSRAMLSRYLTEPDSILPELLEPRGPVTTTYDPPPLGFNEALLQTALRIFLGPQMDAWSFFESSPDGT